MGKKVLVGMSGGVDSSVAAYLSKQQGFDCIGATMKLFGNDDVGIDGEKSCCSLEDAADARSVADKLNMPYYVFNFTKEFKEQVIGRFIKAYENGETPNPCIDCNRFLKFDRLLTRAKELDMDYIATGHYARIEYIHKKDRYFLKKAVDKAKDQSYFLYTLTQEQLKRTLFPLGGLNKAEVRAIAREQGFINAQKRESQDICFVRNGGYADFIRQYTGREFPKGRFADLDGNDLGEHKGIIYYTVGQRKGLGAAFGAPMYVCAKDAKSNTVTLGEIDSLLTREVAAENINLISAEEIKGSLRATAKIRYNMPAAPCVVEQRGDTIKAVFDEPQRAPAKGQSLVIYDGDEVVGGGVIGS